MAKEQKRTLTMVNLIGVKTMEPKPINSKKIKLKNEFQHRSNIVAYLVLAGVVSLMMIMISVGHPQPLTAGTYIIALASGMAIFILLEALSPKKQVIVENGKLHYGKKMIDMNHLTDVSATNRVFVTSSLASARFYIKLTDRAGNQLRLPLGYWANQDDMLLIISGYAAITGGVVNKQATKLFDLAKNNFS